VDQTKAPRRTDLDLEGMALLRLPKAVAGRPVSGVTLDEGLAPAGQPIEFTSLTHGEGASQWMRGQPTTLMHVLCFVTCPCCEQLLCLDADYWCVARCGSLWPRQEMLGDGRALTAVLCVRCGWARWLRLDGWSRE